MKRRGKIAVGSDPFEVLVPGLARVGTQLLLRFAEQQVPGAFDVIGGEGMAVVPFDALAQPERQFSAVFVPRPIGGQIRDDRLQAVLRHVLLVEDEIVEDAHHRDLGRVESPLRGSTCWPDCPGGRFSERRQPSGREPVRCPKWWRTTHRSLRMRTGVAPSPYPSLFIATQPYEVWHDRMGALLPLGPLAARAA